MPHLRAALATLLLAGPTAAFGQTPPEEAPRYFAPPPEWRFRVGTDAAFALSDRDPGPTDQTNDGSSNLDRLWLRLYGRLSYQDKAELVIDLFSRDANEPEIFGLYARLEPKPWLGARVGVIPLTVGGWQERATPSHQPLINQPLHSQYLFALRNDSVPGSADELLSQRGLGRATRFSVGEAGRSDAVTAYYERCWPIGAEVFGSAGGLRYRFAVTEGAPGSPVVKTRELRVGTTLQGRLTYKLGSSLRLGGSWARGPYLLSVALPSPPAGRRVSDYHQELYGADLRVEHRALRLHGEWVLSRYESPFVAERLSTHGAYGEAAVRVAAGVELAARASALRFSRITSAAGASEPWDYDALRIEAGGVWRGLDDHLALKAAWQRTSVDRTPRSHEDIGTLQLSFAY